jgi:hypothetical protein
VAVFIITALFLAHRAQNGNLKDLDPDDDDDDNDGDDNRQMAPPANTFQANDPMRMVTSLRMADGQTIIHIPPINTSSSRVYDPSPLVLSSASSMGSSFDERDYRAADLLPSRSYDTTEDENSSHDLDRLSHLYTT